MKPKWIYALVIFFLSSCVPVDTPTSMKTFPPAGSYTSVPSSTAMYTPISTSSSTTISIEGTPLPTQLTIVPTLNPTQVIQQEEIKSVIQEYFEIHYQALSVSPPANFQETGFGNLVSDGSEAKDFLITEMGKLAVERKHYELNELLYVEYDFSLRYIVIDIDESTKKATVSLGDCFDVIRESAVEANPEDPTISSGGLSHEIVLHYQGGQWKIISDVYRDALWRTLRKSESSTDDILRGIEIMLADLVERASPTP
ncbi:MAG: hypothetical protein K8R16_04405 [Anaerolineales bacterium]|nr:hypothetical protein [Anaerolineales bacterium]